MREKSVINRTPTTTYMNWCRMFSHREIWKALWRSFLEPALGITWLHLRVFREKWTACVTTMCFFSPASPVPIKRVANKSLQDPFTLASGFCDECTKCNPLKHPQQKKQAWKLKQTIRCSHLLTPQPGLKSFQPFAERDIQPSIQRSEVSGPSPKSDPRCPRARGYTSEPSPSKTNGTPSDRRQGPGGWMEDPPNLREVSPWFFP